MDNHWSNNVITILLIILCSLAAIDLWRQFVIHSKTYWFNQYKNAVKSSNDFWKIGYRLEELEIKLQIQKNIWDNIRQTFNRLNIKSDKSSLLRKDKIHNLSEIQQLRKTIQNYLYNDSLIYQFKCEDNGPYLRIGVNDYRTDERDICQIHTATTDIEQGPHTMFEMIPLDEGTFALKSLANNLYIKTIPPPADSLSLPWKLVIGGSIPGAAEKFRITEQGYLYSPLMQGFYQCGKGLMVKGFDGKYNNKNKFIMERVSNDKVNKMRELKDLSDQILKIQNKYVEDSQSSIKTQKAAVHNIIGLDNLTPVKIAICVPMTSKSTSMKSVTESPFWSNLFDSFMKSIDWKSNKFIFKFYLGFDKADPLYDTGDAWSDMRSEFKNRATFRMQENLLSEQAIISVLEKELTLTLMDFEHLTGAPTQIVSQLVLKAYVDNFDYFYQVNDDTSIVTPNWPPKLITALAANPSIPNFGVTGPTDTNNDKIFTHSFVHRTHIEVFGHMFPTSFKNWYSDDWITTVYGSEHTFRTDVEIKHNVAAQKEKGYTRYDVDYSAQLRLIDELRQGYVQIDEWLKKNSLPRLPLPNICGYSPLVEFLSHKLKNITQENKYKEIYVH